MKRLLSIILAAVLPLGCAAADREPSIPSGMVKVPAGVYRPLFTSKDDLKAIPVPAFYLDAAPVSNEQFLLFVRENPRWQRSAVKRIFADESYLKNWVSDLDPGTNAPLKAPVTCVSWFAAKSFAAWRDERLPTTAEWEWAASAGFKTADGSTEPAFQHALMRWYSMPAPDELPAADAGPTNFYGIHNLHGLIWEWTSDFNSVLITGDARGDTGLDRQLFCAAGSLDATDRANIPAFMRYGFRSSLKAAYTVHNLGFRCAKSIP
jgi:sulfatase modifying factor 1